MRCPDCNKFVSFDEPQVELSDEGCEVDVPEAVPGPDTKTRPVNFHFTAEARLVLPCGECGTELKEATFSMEADAEHACGKVPDDEGERAAKIGDMEEAEFDDPEGTDRMETKDRHGRPIKSARYMRHFYGVSVGASVKCPFCEEEVHVEMNDETQASGMDELT